MKIVTDIFEYAGKHLPKYNSISISGYHIREAGATAAQEIAFTLSNAIAYVKAALSTGLKIDDFAPRLSFFFASHNDLFEEVAKFRAARRMWAKIVKEDFGAKKERSWLLRFHTQTGGSTLTAQQPENNIVRTTMQALAATLGGTQSLHTNSYDEALGLPTEKSVEIALRTQQILAYESGLANSADPLAGSYFVEYLTDELEKKAKEIMFDIEKLGGSVECVENGYFQEKISDAAYKFQKSVEEGKTVVVGVNKFKAGSEQVQTVLKVDPNLEKQQIDKLQKLKGSRNAKAHENSMNELRQAAGEGQNIVEPVLNAVENFATLGEISDVFRDQWKEYREQI
jgi:methylmalonyl-CoA mutase N-terminal domain/subunit